MNLVQYILNIKVSNDNLVCFLPLAKKWPLTPHMMHNWQVTNLGKKSCHTLMGSFPISYTFCPASYSTNMHFTG